MNRRTWCLHGVLAAGLLVALCSGCGSKPAKPAPVAMNGPEPTAQNIPGPPATIPGPPPATATIPGPPADEPQLPPATNDQIPGPPPPAATVDVPAASPSSPPEPPATPTETVKADVGVGIKGRSLDPHEGVLVTPAKAYFAVREKVVFQIQIPQALQLYKAADNPVPLTFDEFKQNILDPNKIKLPQLPPGHTYEWDPEQEQLMVKRPVK
jgi:hypothetical protein